VQGVHQTGSTPIAYRSVVVMVGPDGILVEQVLVQRDLRRPPTPMLRVRHGSYYLADSRTVAEVATLIDLARLEPR